jgi:FecR-like protein
MRHKVVRFTCFCLLSLSVAASMAVAQEQQTRSAPSAVAIAGATIAEWKGDVHLSLPGQSSSNPLRGEQLPVGTILDTGSGRLLLHLNDGSEVLIRPHTRLQLQQPSFTDPSYFQLLLGRIRALINKRTGGAVPFELGTPSAVIAVRGTQFDVEVNRQNVTEVDVIDGLVEVSGRKPGAGSILVEPGFSTRVGLDSGPEQPEPTYEIRPEVERPELRENEISGKSELEVEFERAEAEREIGIEESAEIAERTELQEIQEISDHAAVKVEVEVKPGSEPQ